MNVKNPNDPVFPGKNLQANIRKDNKLKIHTGENKKWVVSDNFIMNIEDMV